MTSQENQKKKLPSEQKWFLRFVRGLFYLFLIATVLNIFFLLFVPTPQEWPGSFPDGVTWEDLRNLSIFEPFLKHLVLFNQHFAFANFIDIINGAFLTMFVYKIGIDLRTGIEKNEGKVQMSVYVEWAMGSLISGIIFASARFIPATVSAGVLYVGAIVAFAFVLRYVLYNLRKKMKDEESST